MTIVRSKWTHSLLTYCQTLALPNHSNTFRLRFDVLADIGDEVLLEFLSPISESKWFYTFNSADIRLRSPFPEKKFYINSDINPIVRKGVPKRSNSVDYNYHPIVGGLFIKQSERFLEIFPKFPLGAGMKEVNKRFQLHLHRNPQNSDQLGLNAALNDTMYAQHDFLIKIGDLNSTDMWRNYLEHKNSYIIFAVEENEEDISTKLEQNADRFENWNSTTNYSMSQENRCVYLSSLGVDQDKMYASMLNICDKSKEFILDSTLVREEVLINENSVTNQTNQIQHGDEIIFEINSNSGKNVIMYPVDNAEGGIRPFNLTVYEVDHTCALQHLLTSEWTNKPEAKEYRKQKPESSYFDSLGFIFYLDLALALCILVICILLRFRRKRQIRYI